MTFKELSFKGKVEHIWEYYRLRIFMIICLTAAAISIMYTVFIKPHPETYCGIAAYGQYISIEDINKINTELNEKFNINTKEYTVDMQSFYADATDPTIEADLNQKFNTYVYASQFHLLLGNKENTESFVSVGYLTPITDFLSEEQVANLNAQGKVLYAVDPYTNENKPMAVDISNSAFLKKYNLYQEEPCYIGFVPMPDNNEKTLNIFNALIAE